ncbi:MAG: plastocyanin/azurin family copper-binding protein [Rhodoferax sp.]
MTPAPWHALQTLLLCLGCVLHATAPAHAAEHTIHMRNAGTDGSMVFEPAYVHAQVGDTLRFEPSNTGHYVRSLATPALAPAWNSPLDAPFTVTLEHPGLYYYMCPPHLMMGMVGLVQVGDAVNHENALQAMQSSKARMYSNGQRVDALAQQVRPPLPLR